MLVSNLGQLVILDGLGGDIWVALENISSKIGVWSEESSEVKLSS